MIFFPRRACQGGLGICYNPAVAELVGTDVLYRKWAAAPAASPPRAVFLLVHGLGAYSSRWEFLADFLARHGFASYGLELRGFGRTPDRPRGHVDSFRVWDRDVLALRDLIEKDLPGRKVFLLGESMGGLIAFNLAALHPDLFAGQVLIAPAFKNAMKFPPGAYVKLALGLLPRPKLMVDVPFTSEMVTRDSGYLAVMNASPDELRRASLKLLGGFLPEQSRAKRRAAKLAVPVLMLVPGRDLLVDERAGRRIFERLALEDKTLLEYPDMLHALSIDLGRERVFQDIVDWAGRRV
jgi:acylglycerol lipase